MQEQLTNYIKGIITVTDEELDKILSYFKPLEVEKNELLVIHGQTSQRTFFVGNGCLRIFFITEDGQEATLLQDKVCILGEVVIILEGKFIL